MNEDIKKPDERYVTIATKVSRRAAEQLARIAKKKNTTIYELIQLSCDTLIRYMDDRHNLSKEMEQAMSIFEHMIGWADALNLADPAVAREVAEAVYILQDPDGKKKGFRAVMVEKPFCGLWNQTANVQQIFDRLFNVLMPDMYMKLYRAKILMGYRSVVEVINALADADVIAHLNEEFRKEFEDAGRADNARAVRYGRKAHGFQHRTPDSVAQDQRIKFDDYDRDIAREEADDGTR
jgi:hypothetical protein